MMKRVIMTGVLIVMGLIVTTYAAAPTGTQFSTPKARSTQIRYERELAQLKQKHERELALLQKKYGKDVNDWRTRYIAELEKVQGETTKAGNLDEALRIRDAVGLLKKELPQKTPKPVSAVVSEFPDGAYERGPGYYRVFGRDNTIWDGYKDRKKYVGTWKRIGPHAVLITWKNLNAVSVFWKDDAGIHGLGNKGFVDHKKITGKLGQELENK